MGLSSDVTSYASNSAVGAWEEVQIQFTPAADDVAKIKVLADLVTSYFPKIKVKFKKRDVLMPERGTLSILKAKKVLGYKPEFNLAKGIHEYISWYKSLDL